MGRQTPPLDALDPDAHYWRNEFRRIACHVETVDNKLETETAVRSVSAVIYYIQEVTVVSCSASEGVLL